MDAAATVHLTYRPWRRHGQLGLLFDLFNLSVVIPQLVVSLGLGAIAETQPARGDLFVIAALALFASALA